MPNDEVLLENAVSRFGVRRVEIVRMGAAPDRSNWIPFLSPTSLETMEFWSWQEEALDVHHLVVVWNAREVVELHLEDGRTGKAVLWWIGKDNFRQAATDAATVHRLDLHQPGVVCLAAKLPRGAPVGEDGQPKAMRIEVLYDEIDMDLQIKDWVPSGYLVIGGVWLKQ